MAADAVCGERVYVENVEKLEGEDGCECARQSDYYWNCGEEKIIIQFGCI